MKKNIIIISLICLLFLFISHVFSPYGFLSGYGGMEHRVVEEPDVSGKTCEIRNIEDKEIKRLYLPRSMFGYKVIGIGKIQQKAFDLHPIAVAIHKTEEAMKMVTVRMRHDPRGNDRRLIGRAFL